MDNQPCVSVFVVSWINPDERLKDKTFEEYMTEGLLAATDAAKRETGVEKVNVIGYCVGGTLLGTALAYLAARGEEPFASATFLASRGIARLSNHNWAPSLGMT